IQRVRWREDRLIAGSQDFEAFMEAAFRSVDEEAEDEYGGGSLRFYHLGGQALIRDVRSGYLLVTGILEAPQPGRWALVLKTGGWRELRVGEVLELPPAAAEQLLAFRPLPQPAPHPAPDPR